MLHSLEKIVSAVARRCPLRVRPITYFSGQRFNQDLSAAPLYGPCDLARTDGKFDRMEADSDHEQKIKQMSGMIPSQPTSSGNLDACLAPAAFSPERFFFFTLTFLIMTIGSVTVFLYLGDDPFGVQIAAIVCYTSAIVLYTFSANRRMPRYLFRCPIVQTQLPRIALRHLIFVAVVFVLLTAGIQLRPYVPPSWLVASGARKSIPPLATVLFILSACLAIAQILTNRSLLNRAHLQHNSREPDHANSL